MATTSSSSRLIRTSRRALSYDGELKAHSHSQVAPDTFGPDHASQLGLEVSRLHSPTCHPRPRSIQQSSPRLQEQAKSRSNLNHVRYDAEDRLIGWDRSDASLDQSWDLSPVGDWNSITQNTSVQNRTHGPVHEILSASGQAVQHDPKGNMTLIPPVLRPGSDPLKLKWDFDNRLRAADTDNDGVDDIFYRWDALGRRVGRDDGTTSTIYFQDGQQTLADYAAGAAAGSPSYTYVYGDYIDEVILRNEGGGARYYHRNGQYSIIALTNVGGSIVERYAYTAYGQVTFTNASGTVQAASASNNRYTYTGREWDAGLSLYHYRARMYDPAAGRFVSRDPIGYVDGKNLYGNYFSLGSTDPGGLVCTLVGAGPPRTSAYTAIGGIGAGVGTNPSPHSFAPADEIVCQASKSRTIDYSCTCPRWGWWGICPWRYTVTFAHAVPQTVYDTFKIPGKLELIHTVHAPTPIGLPGGPGVSIDFSFLRPEDQAGANARCVGAARTRNMGPFPAPANTIACP